MAFTVEGSNAIKISWSHKPTQVLMYYEATIASSGGDDATLAKSLIISLEGAAAI
jgi:hypothetical protein